MTSSTFSNWFIQLRWYAFFGQLAVLWLAVSYFQLTLPWPTIAGVLVLIPLTNALAVVPIIKERAGANLVGALLAFDTLVLTVVLHQSGGPMNPFSIVYLLHVVLAAILLNQFWAWGISALACISYGLLFIDSRAVPEWHMHGMHHGFSLHLHGMLFAFVLAAILVAYFVNRIVGELRKKERKLERLENLSDNQQRLAALTTLTASAAHELGTPLATLAVLAHEVEISLKSKPDQIELAQDLGIMKEQIERCKSILQNMSLGSGAALGEQPSNVLVKDLMDAVCAGLCSAKDLSIVGDNVYLSQIPKQALTLAFRSFLKNALEASEYNLDNVAIVVGDEPGCSLITISDFGLGMSDETQQNLGQPFFSTKGPDKGMGLGFYLAKLTVEQMGGSIVVESQLGKGTTIVIRLPKPNLAQVAA